MFAESPTREDTYFVERDCALYELKAWWSGQNVMDYRWANLEPHERLRYQTLRESAATIRGDWEDHLAATVTKTLPLKAVWDA